MAYTPVPAVSAGDFGRASWATIVKNDLADHESRIVAVEATGTGDVSGPASSVASEIALFDGTTGKLIKRATGTGYLKASSGVYQTPSATVPTSDLSGTIALATQVSGNLPLANLPTNFAQIFKATVTLTDAQIKALPTTPITIVAAPSGGQRLMVVTAMFRLSASAGAYTNINTTYSTLQLQTQTNANWLCTPIVNDNTASPALTRLTSFLSAGAFDVQVSPYVEGNTNWVVPSAEALTSDFDAKTMQIAIDNNGSGNLTGGNAANTMTVYVLYLVIG